MRRTPHRSKFYLRAVLSFIVFSLLCIGIFEGLSLCIPRGAVWIKDILGFIVIYGVAVGAVAVCFECDGLAALFGGSASFCVEHISRGLYGIFSGMLRQGTHAGFYILLYVVLAAALLVGLFFLTEKIKLWRIDVNNVFMFVLSIAAIISTVVLKLVVIHYNTVGENTLAISICVNISGILMCGVIFALLLNLVVGKRTEAERDIVKEMLEAEREQFYFEKSMIDAINIKCHDLKHQIAALDGEKAKELRREINEVVDRYNAGFETGNAALDTILTRKNFMCLEKKIELTCSARGAALDFMSELDIYSLYGNILDNAIESTEKVVDENKRVITLATEKRGNFVYIHAENYFEGTLHFDGGELRTTKSDSALHGFGLKSIGMIVEKYNGSLLIDVKKDNRFCLEIMFPL